MEQKELQFAVKEGLYSSNKRPASTQLLKEPFAKQAKYTNGSKCGDGGASSDEDEELIRHKAVYSESQLTPVPYVKNGDVVKAEDELKDESEEEIEVIKPKPRSARPTPVTPGPA
jgi:hypothetical protein